jgi:hypothetical protein
MSAAIARLAAITLGQGPSATIVTVGDPETVKVEATHNNPHVRIHSLSFASFLTVDDIPLPAY